MIRLSTLVWLAVVAAVGFAMFEVKYEVMSLEDELARTNHAIQLDQDAIHVLKAEWSFLSQPRRIEDLAHRHLELAPIGTAQLGSIDAIPLRPEAVPPVSDAAATLPAQPQPARGTTPEPKPKPRIPPHAAAARTVADATLRTER